MAQRQSTSGTSAEINVTPMIDVLLVLLIIFMLTVPSQLRMEVQLPDPRGASGEAVSIVLEVLPRGEYRVNQRPVSEPSLGDRLRHVYAGRPDKTVLVKGSPRASYQEVIAAMDSARGAGVRVIGIRPKQ